MIKKVRKMNSKMLIGVGIACGLLLGSALNVHAVIFSYSSIDYPDATNTFPEDINNSGHIVGYYGDAAGNEHGFKYDGTYSSFDYPSATSTIAQGINDSGHIVGIYQDASVDALNEWHGFFYDGTTYNSIDYPEAITTQAHGINDTGNIVGSYQDAGGSYHGFLFDGTTYTPLMYPATGINDSGTIVGAYPVWRGYLYDGTTYSTFDVPESTRTAAGDINDSGDISGFYSDNHTFFGFYYDGKNYSSLEYPEAYWTNAHGINDSGNIVGIYRYPPAGDARGFVASVAPEPISSTLFIVGGATLGFRIFRKKFKK